jgi:hypothetical protein
MNFQIRQYNNAIWHFISAKNPKEAIKELFKVNTIFLKKREGFDIYINPTNKQEFLVNKLRKSNVN